MREISYDHFGYAIYVLQDVKSETLRYIGCTNNLARRMKQHRPKDDPKTPLEKWIARVGKMPRVLIIAEISDHTTARWAERFWIRRLHEYGRYDRCPVKLLNQRGITIM